MPRIPLGLVAALALALDAGRADAQRTLRTIGRDVRDGVFDALHVWTAPARADGRDWATAGLAGAAIVAVGATDRSIDRWITRHPSSVPIDALRPFREGRDVPLVELGSPKRLQPLSGALYVAGFAADSRALRDAGMGCAAALQAQATVHMLVLQVAQRERPLTAGGDPYDLAWGSGPWERHAFYSGHAANVMTCVTYWNTRFDLGAAEPVLYAAALGIGLGRMADQRHWPSDVATGALIGFAVGRSVGRRARARAAADASPAADPAPANANRPPWTAALLDRTYLAGGAGHATVGWRMAF